MYYIFKKIKCIYLCKYKNKLEIFLNKEFFEEFKKNNLNIIFFK